MIEKLDALWRLNGGLVQRGFLYVEDGDILLYDRHPRVLDVEPTEILGHGDLDGEAVQFRIKDTIRECIIRRTDARRITAVREALRDEEAQ